MLRSVDGFWITAVAFGKGAFTNSSYHFFDPPGLDVYATISLSGITNLSPRDEPRGSAFAYITRWVAYGSDGKLSGLSGPAGNAGHEQNAAVIRNCGYLEFALAVENHVEAAAQINIFRF